MPVQKDISLRILADLDKYEAEIKRKLPNITDKAAATAALKLSQQMTRAQFKAADAAGRAAAKAGRSWTDAFRIVGAQQLTAMAKAAGAAVLTLGQEVADMRNELADASTLTSLNVETLAGLKLAAEGSGQELGNLMSSLRQWPKRLADTARGTGEAKIAFDELGIAAEDSGGSLRASDDVLRESLSKLQAIESPTLRAARATQIFGKSGTALLQALGGAELDDFVDVAKRFGIDVGPEAAQSAADWQRAMASLSMVSRDLKADLADAFDVTGSIEAFTSNLVFLKTFAANLFPAMADDADSFSDAVGELSTGGVIEAASGAIQGLAKAYADTATLSGLPDPFAFFDRVSSATWADTLDEGSVALEEITAAQGHLFEETDAVSFAIAAATEEAAAFRAALDLVSGSTNEAANNTRTATDSLKEQSRAREQLTALITSANTAQLSGEVKIVAAHEQRLLKLDALAVTADDSALAERARVEETLRTEHELAEFRAAEDEKRLAALQKQRDAEFKTQQEIVSVRQGAAVAAVQLGQGVTNAIESQLRAQGSMNQRAAMAVYVTQLSLGLAQAGISTGIGVARALEAPPYAVPFLVAQALLTGGSAIAQIASVPPPKAATFHAGLWGAQSDEIPALIQKREVVVPTQTVHQNGGPEGVRRALQGGGGDTIVIDFGDDLVEMVGRRVSSRAPRPTNTPAGRRRR